MIRTPLYTVVILGPMLVSPWLFAQSGSPADPKKTPPPAEIEEKPWPTGNAATVNGQPVTEAAVQRVLLRVPAEKHKQLRPEVLDSLIDNVLLDQYLQQVQPTVEAKEVDKRFSEVREEIEKSGQKPDKVLRSFFLTEKDVKDQISADLRWEAFLNKKATEAVLKELFSKEPEIVDGSMVRARHILLTPAAGDAKAAEQAQAQLKQIKQDIEKKVSEGVAKLPKDADKLTQERERCKLLDEAFAAAAKEKSVCPSKDAGGDVNFFARNGIMVEPFAKAAFALKPYQMSDVIKTQYGYHLILVTERKKGTAVEFKTIAEEIKEVYGMRLRVEIVSQLRAQSTVSITPPQ